MMRLMGTEEKYSQMAPFTLEHLEMVVCMEKENVKWPTPGTKETGRKAKRLP